MSTEVQVTLMRHGRSRADDEGVHEGRYDSPLTEAGVAQVEVRIRQWQAEGRRFDRVITSPLQRASKTATLVARALQVPLEEDPDWMEFNNGPLAGLPFDKAQELYPQPAFRNPYEPYWGSGESEWEVYCRAARAVERLVRRGPGRYLVVAHGGILNAALRCIVGAQPPANKQGIWFAWSDTGFADLSYLPNRNQWIFERFIFELAV